MGAYHQMGYDSRNLLKETDLSHFQGAILSPVNEDEEDIIAIINDAKRFHLETIFDPQFYYPKSNRGHLPDWGYFPTDIDTADQSSFGWWKNVNSRIQEMTKRVLPDWVCTPAIVPSGYHAGYYSFSNEIAIDLKTQLESINVQTIQTLIVRMGDLSELAKVMEIASIASSSACDRFYVVLVTDSEPRQELDVTSELKGAMRLIYNLEQSGVKVIVGFSSSDIMLWKAAGASDCATGKYFNLRRFTPSRWRDPKKGGGQTPYWFEESLFAFLRPADLSRTMKRKMLSDASRQNPYGTQILAQLATTPDKSWLGLGWRQYLYWFSEFEGRMTRSEINTQSMLGDAEERWKYLKSNNVLMDQQSNDGSWLRPWRQAIAEAFED